MDNNILAANFALSLCKQEEENYNFLRKYISSLSMSNKYAKRSKDFYSYYSQIFLIFTYLMNDIIGSFLEKLLIQNKNKKIEGWQIK